MALSEFDRNLINRCLNHKPQAWEDFVNRFVGLVIHVINHTAQAKSIRLSAQDIEDVSAEVFLAVVTDDFAILRNFRGESSLATYLTVVARRVVVRHLFAKGAPSRLDVNGQEEFAATEGSAEDRIGNREEVERLMSGLDGEEADVIRMYHLEGRSYKEIATKTGIAENSLGPMLSRARAKMKRSQGIEQ
ncbi:MAG: RNA polymerase sigma-70 factor (ECF subfamily) [Pirellulaceae bacterium]